jgi:ribosomal-protein-alanine N-acetyltransferase
MKLNAIAATGEPVETITGLPELATQVALAYKQLYLVVGFAPPWIGYLVQENEVCVGSCGFKGPPVNKRVEIAYFAFPEHEGRGFATQMARELLRIVSEADAEVIATAQTLPRESASTAILKKLGFVLIGTVNDPEDGEVWEWQR